MALDRAIEAGVLRDTPVLGSIVGVFRTQRNVRDYLFARKLTTFLENLSSVKPEDTREFNESTESDPEFGRKVSEHLTLLLERMDDVEKAPLLARAFAAFLKKGISLVEFKRIARAIDMCMPEDLREVHNFDHANDAHGDITHNLAASGLIEMVSFALIQGPDTSPTYVITDFGRQFVRIVM